MAYLDDLETEDMRTTTLYNDRALIHQKYTFLYSYGLADIIGSAYYTKYFLTLGFAKGEWLDKIAQYYNIYRRVGETDETLRGRVELYIQLINESGTLDIVKIVIAGLLGVDTENITIEERPGHAGMLHLYVPSSERVSMSTFNETIKPFLPVGIITIVYVRLGWDFAKWDIDRWDGVELISSEIPILWWDYKGTWDNAIWGAVGMIDPEEQEEEP